jgi:hypothetical protein
VHWQMNGADFWIEMEEEKIKKLTIKQTNKQTNEWVNELIITCGSDGDDRVCQKESEKGFECISALTNERRKYLVKVEEEMKNKQTFEQLTKQANKQTNEWVNE